MCEKFLIQQPQRGKWYLLYTYSPHLYSESYTLADLPDSPFIGTTLSTFIHALFMNYDLTFPTVPLIFFNNLINHMDSTISIYILKTEVPVIIISVPSSQALDCLVTESTINFLYLMNSLTSVHVWVVLLIFVDWAPGSHKTNEG